MFQVKQSLLIFLPSLCFTDFFLARDSIMQSALYAIAPVCPSVGPRLSVFTSRGWISQKRLKLG